MTTNRFTPKVETFRAAERTLTSNEEMHLKALKAACETLLGVLNSNSPDPACQDKAKEKLRELYMWAELGIRIGMHL